MNDSLFTWRGQTDDESTAEHEATRAPGTNTAAWFFGQSDRGQVRENNEDQFSIDAGRNLFIVADGMGGHAAGEVASLIAVESLDQLLTAPVIEAAATTSKLEASLAEALRQANAAVLHASENHGEWSGMGSTAVVALLHDHSLYIANVGDSRAYLLRGGALQTLSQDHSVAAALAEQNHISPEEIRTHPLRNRLTACLGIEAQIAPYTNQIQLEAGDRILLCSDGLWDMLSDQEINRLWDEQVEAEEAVEALIAAANQAGGQDNITVVAIHVREHEGFLTANGEATANLVIPHLDDTVVVPS